MAVIIAERPVDRQGGPGRRRPFGFMFFTGCCIIIAIRRGK